MTTLTHLCEILNTPLRYDNKYQEVYFFMRKSRKRTGRRRHIRERKIKRTVLGFSVLLLAGGLMSILVQRQMQKQAQASDAIRVYYVSSYEEQHAEKEAKEAQETHYSIAEMRQYIASHAEQYPKKLQELAEKNEEAVEYVFYYPSYVKNSAEQKQVDLSGDLSEEAEEGGVPLLLQWDKRWGYHSYCGGLIGYTGCGPTCLSMVILYLTGDTTCSPDVVADYAEQNGYVDEQWGTRWALMSQGCEDFRIQSEELPVNEERMRDTVENGHPIICSVGKGDFTDQGHFIVLTGYEDGKFQVNDPNSRENSAKLWSYETLRKQIKNMWVFYRNGGITEENMLQ